MIIMQFFLKPIKAYLSLALFRTKWRNKNRDNESLPNNVFPMEKVTVGKGTYVNLNVYSYRNPNEQLKIGCFCSIASDVIFVLSGEHQTNKISTYPFREKIFHLTNSEAHCKGPIIIEDDVWIGVRCTILSGVTIGQGSIIGANSIVTRDIPPYSIFVGNKVIKLRFDKNIVELINSIDFSAFTEKDIEKYKEYMECDVTQDNIQEIIMTFPRKREMN